MTKVLIVDDAKFARIHMEKILKENDFEVVGEASDGKMALEKIREVRPDIVTLDLTMPEMGGIECLRELKKLDYMPTVIVVSALGQEAFVQKAVANGAKGFIVKPFQVEALVKILDRFRV